MPAFLQADLVVNPDPTRAHMMLLPQIGLFIRTSIELCIPQLFKVTTSEELFVTLEVGPPSSYL